MLNRFSLFVLLLMVSACASSPNGAEYKQGSVQALPGHAVIIIYRDSELFDTGFKWAVTDGTRDPVTIEPGVYLPLNVKPGHVVLSAMAYREFRDFLPTNMVLLAIGEAVRKGGNMDAENVTKPIIAMDVQEGGTYYLKTSIKRGSTYPVAVQVDAATAEAELKGKQLPQQ